MSNPNHNPASGLSKDDLRGILLPITTPFTSDGAVDFDGLRSNIRKWNETGIIGYVLMGSTGERVHLDEREYVEVVAAAREEVPGDLRFIVGAGQQSIRGTIEEIHRVSAVGPVDAVLVITPSFYRPSITQSALINYYLEVADAAPVPAILYSMPALTGIRIEPETITRLSEHENIVGLKDSSPDTDVLRLTVDSVAGAFAVMTGNGTVLQKALNAGAGGGILAVGCVAPALCIAIMDAVASGDDKRASKLQSGLTPLAAAVTTRFGIGGLKAALDMNGWKGGYVRPPLRMPDEEARHEISRCMQDAEDVLKEDAAKSAAN